MKYFIIIFIITIILFGLSWGYGWYKGKNTNSSVDESSVREGEAVAYFAGGCFWCVESDYEKLSGVKDVISGYMGGQVRAPSYNQVSSGKTGHREMVKVIYNPNKITYSDLVLYLLKHTDPTDNGGSFYDRGYQYTSAIYFLNTKEQKITEDIIKKVNKNKIFEKAIETSIEPAKEFWLAEDYHQDYYKKNPLQYKYYRKGSGRDKFIEKIWGNGDYDFILEKKGETLKNNKNNKKSWGNYKKPNDEVFYNFPSFSYCFYYFSKSHLFSQG